MNLWVGGGVLVVGEECCGEIINDGASAVGEVVGRGLRRQLELKNVSKKSN